MSSPTNPAKFEIYTLLQLSILGIFVCTWWGFVNSLTELVGGVAATELQHLANLLVM
ncbi:hypothetical protein DE4587_00496 [Mycobacteroides salmoniphilum]|nr:hypothetical protein DE4586_00580 [Mycobacteroides salmoniphilum]TDZ88143.1 hypothetical protein DE4587_00496 [Mycobacteroides salmoniphilum]